MLNVYDSNATAAQNEAVATLMSACGVSVDMNYGPSSGAVSKKCAAALVDYFNYDGSLRYLERDYFGYADWEAEVYNSLAAGCPVLYGGQSNSGGHEFVCDGYSSDGYFHFNWGWGGMSDGYFKLTSLNPGSQGIGGAGSGAGFNFDQDIIVGIKPYDGQATLSPSISNRGDFSVSATTANLGETVTMKSQPFNSGSLEATFYLGCRITAADGTSINLSGTGSRTLAPGVFYTRPVSFQVTLPSTLADGEYTVTPAFLSDDKWYDMPTALGKVRSINMTVADGTATFAAPATAANPRVTGFAFDNDVYSGMAYNITGTIENPGELEYYGAVYGMVKNGSNNILLSSMQVDLNAGESTEFAYGGTFPSSIAAGDYKFVFVVEASSGYLPISDELDFTVKAKPASTKLTLGDVSTITDSNKVPKNDLGVKTSLTCTEGVYYGTLDMMVFQLFSEQTSSGVTQSTWRSVAEYPSEMLYLNAGDTKDVVYHSDFSEGKVGERYLLKFYYGNDSFDTREYIVLDNPTTGVSTVIAVDEPTSVEIYDLNGVLVSGKPAPGHYIMAKHMADGSVTTEHIIIK